MKYNSYYKKVDRSLLEWGATIPKDYVIDFLAGDNIPVGTARKVEVLFDKKKEFGLLRIEFYPFCLEGAGYFVLIEKKGNNWIIKMILNDWTS